MAKSVKVIDENSSGRNIKFQDKQTKEVMTRAGFVKKIESEDKYSNDYYVRKINGLKTPVSKPDGKEGNNLG